MILFMVLKQFSDGLGETKWPMYLSLASLPVNGLLNYLFIFGKFGFPRMELEGAGLATFISRVLLFIVIIILISSGTHKILLLLLIIILFSLGMELHYKFNGFLHALLLLLSNA